MSLPLPALKPYPDYKPSGVEWLGEVPKHWDTRRTKSLLSQRSEKGFAEEPLLAATQTKGVVRKEQYENRTVMALKDLQLLKLVRVGDFVISLRSFQGGIEFAREQGIISPAYTILHVDEQKHHAFLAKLFKSRPYIENLLLHVTGIRQGQNIDYEKLARSYLPFPTLSEQTAIARFLDHVDERISRYINAKERLISLLEEQRQAVIHRAVTRGLDPNVRLKPSGNELLGNVPDHWEIRRLKTLCSMKSGDYISGMKIESMGKYPVYGGNGIRGYTSDYNKDGNFVLIGRQGALCGNVHVVRGRFWATEHAVIATLCPEHVVDWFGFILKITNLNQYSIAAAQPGLAVERILNIALPVPSQTDQFAIAEFLKKTTADIDAATSRAHGEIELLKEYRTRLIADVVTGKLDVREATFKLPKVPDESRLPDKVDDANQMKNDR